MYEAPVPPDPFAASAANNGFDFEAALGFLWRRWKFIAVTLALVLLVGTVYRLRQTPVYTAAADILLAQPREKAPGEGAVVNDTDLTTAVLEGQMALIRSTVFLRRVVEQEHLADPGHTAARWPKSPTSVFSSLSSFFSPLLSLFAGAPVAKEPQADQPAPPAAGPDSIPPAEMRAIDALQGALDVKRVAEDGYVFAISITSTDPAWAAQLANAVANAYLIDKLDARFDAAKRASAWLSNRLVGLRNQLHASEEAVTQFRAEHGLVESNGVTMPQQQLSTLNAHLTEAKADLIQKQNQLDLLAHAESRGSSLLSVPGIANTGTLQGLQMQESALSAREANLLARYGAAYPLVVHTRAQLRAVERSIAAETARLAAGIRNDYRLAQARVASLERAVQQATQKTNLADATAIRLTELERTEAINKTLFEDFLKQAKVTQAQSTFEARDARIITPAAVPGVPSSMSTKRFVAIELVLGLLLGVGGAYVKERLDGGFTTPRQIREQLGLPLLASFSHLARHDLKFERSVVPMYDLPIVKPLWHFGEAIRSLRSTIRMIDVEHPPKIIQVASAVPGEGKTMISLSLAASAAAARLEVLLIDADLRHSTATRIFGRQKEPGLVDLVLGEATLADVVRVYEKGGYWCIGAGSQTQNPTDLLGSERMKALIAVFRERYDLVIIDSPPVAPVMDGVVVSPLCDKIIFVVKWDATARELVKASVGRLSVHRKIAGVVFNQVNERQAQKYGRDAYYAHYPSSLYYQNYYRR